MATGCSGKEFQKKCAINWQIASYAHAQGSIEAACTNPKPLVTSVHLVAALKAGARKSRS
jgi:hypothetical protein